MELLFVYLMAAFVALSLYLLPGLIAVQRKHPSKGAIMALTVLTAWTGGGWIILMAWALTPQKKPAGFYPPAKSAAH